jgi:hypothetical protein
MDAVPAVRRIGTGLRGFLAIYAECWQDLPAVLDRGWPIRTVLSPVVLHNAHGRELIDESQP